MAFSNKVKRILKRGMKRHIELTSRGWSVTEENADWRAILDRCWVNGQIGISVSGMDCDCSAYGRSYVIDMPNNVIALKRWFDHHNEGLDGPESMSFLRPDEIDRSQDWSRDLALEAYEGGHPHVVYA